MRRGRDVATLCVVAVVLADRWLVLVVTAMLSTAHVDMGSFACYALVCAGLGRYRTVVLDECWCYYTEASFRRWLVPHVHQLEMLLGSGSFSHRFSAFSQHTQLSHQLIGPCVGP